MRSQTLAKEKAVVPDFIDDLMKKTQRKRSGTVRLPWSSWFADTAGKMVVTESFVVRMQLLERLQSHITAHAFIYPNEDTKRVGRRSLLLILSHLITPLKNVPVRTLPLFYSLISSLVLREEFNLDALFPLDRGNGFGYDPLEDGEDPLNIALFQDYREELLHLQRFVFDKLVSQYLVYPHKEFIIAMLPVLYFRVPILCGPFVDALSFGSEEGIGWRQTVMKAFDESIWVHTVSDHSDTDNNTFYQQNPSLFRWPYFVTNEDQRALVFAMEHRGELQNVLSRPLVFFRAVSGILDHVIDLCKSEIRWNLVQGYWNLIRSVLVRVSQLSPSDYDRNVIDCVVKAAENAELVPVLIEVVLRNTNAFSRDDVNNAVNVVHRVLDVSRIVTENGEVINVGIPSAFDYEFFFSCLDVLLSNDDFQIVIKTLCLVFNQSGRFFGDRRKRLFELVLEKHFLRLFLHWSYLVRWYFVYLLVFKIRRRGFKYSRAESLMYSDGFIRGDSKSDVDYLKEKAFQVVNVLTTSIGGLFGSFAGFHVESETPKKPLRNVIEHPYSSITSLSLESALTITFTELSQEEIELDDSIENMLEFSLTKVRRCMGRGSVSSSSFEDHPELDKVYCKLALEEYLDLCEYRHYLYHRKDFVKTLGKFQGISPELVYQVTRVCL